jgi:hypothetical protein
VVVAVDTQVLEVVEQEDIELQDMDQVLYKEQHKN